MSDTTWDKMDTPEKLNYLKDQVENLAREFREARKNTNRITDNIDRDMSLGATDARKKWETINNALEDLKKRVTTIENRK